MDFDQSSCNFRIIHVNIRGVNANKSNLEHYLEEHNLPEIVTINQAMLRGDKTVKIKGYYCAARREPVGMSGKHGSMILVKETIQDVVELDFLLTQFQEEVIGIEIKGTRSQPGLNIVTYYNPPGNRVNPGIFCRSLYNNSYGTIFTGDLNCKHLAWGSSHTDPLGDHLLDTLNDQDWIILNDGAKTRIDPKSGKEEVLDLIVCTPNILHFSPGFHVGDCIGSDHLPLHCSLKRDGHHSRNPIYYRKISQMDCTRFKNIIESRVALLPEKFETARELDRIADMLPSLVKDAYEEACPLKRAERGRRPISPLIMGLINQSPKGIMRPAVPLPCFFDVVKSQAGSRAAAPTGDEVL